MDVFEGLGLDLPDTARSMSVADADADMMAFLAGGRTLRSPVAVFTSSSQPAMHYLLLHFPLSVVWKPAHRHRFQPRAPTHTA